MHAKVTVFVVLSAVLLQACAKKVVPSGTTAPPVPKTIPIEEIDFEYLHGKARMNYKDDKKERDVKANIRIHKDSVIWMTFSYIGVQGGRALINKDSVTIMSTVDKEYYTFDYAELSKRFNFKIDYNVIQSAMLGNLIMAMGPQDQIQEMPNYNQLDQQQGTVAIKNYINRTTKKLENFELTESITRNALRIEYSNFQPVSQKSFPYKGVVNLFYKTTSGIINITITFDYTKVEVGDKQLKFPFNIPRRYERR